MREERIVLGELELVLACPTDPESLIDVVRRSGVKRLTAISNNAGADRFGLWSLLDNRQVAK